MERLTVNKPVSEMNMIELAHNCCYISEDGSASYRDFQTDIDAREFTRRLMRIYGDEDLSEGDTELDEEVMVELKYDPEIYPSALIALFYRNMWAMAELHSKLKYYEDAEEQGLLLRLPCKPEDKLYWISDEDEDFNYEPIEEVEVAEFSYNGYSIQIWFADKEDKEYPILPSVAIGNELFLTKEEAEQKLAEMKGE